MTFIKAKYLDNKIVRYESDQGELIDYIGGTWSWRNNNPGNIIIKGTFAKRHGSIGSAGGFAVFPSYETGESALVALLKTKKNQEKSIGLLISGYAPKEDKNDPENYKNLLKKFTGLDSDKKLKELNAAELAKLIKAIIRVEGYKEGKIVPVLMRKILEIKEVKGVITSYLIEEYGWIDKVKAVYFVSKKIIDAVIVESKNGKFLRSRPDNTTSNNLKK